MELILKGCFLFSLLGAVLCIPVVHVVPHSHCDAGYRESFQEYYDIQVHNIINTMLTALNESSSRKFVWEETSFLSLWWEKATFEQKVLMKRLIDEKRLEMIGGGWTMHDEAVNNAATIMHQMTLGLKFLKDNLNVRPKHEWHIDPFGHSLMMPELYSALKYDGIVINRIPDTIKQRMRKEQSLEFMWHSTFTNATIFTHVLDMHYSTPIIIGLNTLEKALSLANTCNERLKSYQTDQLLIPFGSDFNFQNATEQFSKMEEIMDYINQRPDVFNLRMQFSTLEDYFSIVMSMDSPTFPQLTDVDFFPYIPCYPCYSEICGGIKDVFAVPCALQTPDAYWSGFYTSKPAQKLLAREHEATSAVLDSLNLLYPFLYDELKSVIETAHQTKALLTHHDAITGTSFPIAYNDYNARLAQSLGDQRDAIGLLKDAILCKGEHSWGPFQFNTSAALGALSDSNIAVIAVYNPLMKERSDYVRIELPKGLCLKGTGTTSNIVVQQVDNVLYVPMTIGPLEIQTLFLSKTECPRTKQPNEFKNIDINGTFSNGYLQLVFNKTNHVIALKNAQTGESMDLFLKFTEVYEKKSTVFEVPDSVCDGSNVYTYVPDKGSTPLLPVDEISTIVTSDGPLVWEVQQVISGFKDSTCPIRMTLRLFKPIEQDSFFQNFFEVQNTVGPLQEEPANSIVFSIETSLKTNSQFTTYTSGLYSMLRQYNNSKPPQGNFYPLVGRASMEDKANGIGIIVSTKRPMAVSGKDGSLDLLLHRRIKIWNDPRSNDISKMADPVYIGYVSNTTDLNEVSYEAMSRSQSPFTTYAAIVPSVSDWNTKCASNFRSLEQSLPKNVKLFGLEILERKLDLKRVTFGLRLVNIGKTTVQIDLSDLFVDATFASIQETTPDYGIVLGNVDNSVLKLPSYKLTTVILSVKFEQ